MNPMVDKLQAMLAAGKDSALLRYTLGKAFLDAGQLEVAREHLLSATQQDAQYSVAWKSLGKACLELNDVAAARKAWEQGLVCAEAKGDAQVAKELTVFLRRLDKAAAQGD